MNTGQFPVYKSLIERAQIYGESRGVEVLFGIEAEVFPNSERLESMRKVLAAEQFDFVLGSLHHQLPIFRRWLTEQNHKTDQDKINAYFVALAEGAASGLYDSMSHPDVIRIYGTIDSFEPEDHESTIIYFLETLVKHDVHMEVNTSGLTKGVYKIHPDPIILRWARRLGVKLTIGSDSHNPKQVGQFFPQAYNLLDDIGFEHISYFKDRTSVEVSLESILSANLR